MEKSYNWKLILEVNLFNVYILKIRKLMVLKVEMIYSKL